MPDTGSEAAELPQPSIGLAWLVAQAKQHNRGYMPPTLVPSASGVTEPGHTHYSEGKLRLAWIPPRTEKQVLPTAEAAVFEGCLAENELGADMLGGSGQVPERLWVNFSGSVNGNNSTCCFTFSYQRAWRTFFSTEMLALSNNTDNIIIAIKY